MKIMYKSNLVCSPFNFLWTQTSSQWPCFWFGDWKNFLRSPGHRLASAALPEFSFLNFSLTVICWTCCKSGLKVRAYCSWYMFRYMYRNMMPLILCREIQLLYRIQEVNNSSLKNAGIRTMQLYIKSLRSEWVTLRNCNLGFIMVKWYCWINPMHHYLNIFVFVQWKRLRKKKPESHIF